MRPGGGSEGWRDGGVASRPRRKLLHLGADPNPGAVILLTF